MTYQQLGSPVASDWVIYETPPDATDPSRDPSRSQGFDPAHLHHQETVFTLSNGYLGTRGSFEEGYPGASPATFINGVYDDAPIVSPELVNCPDWLPCVVLVNNSRFRLDQGEVLHYQRHLNLYTGVVHRVVRWRSPQGHTLDLEFERFVSLADRQVVALRCRITPLDFTAPVEVHTSLNGYADNQGLLHWTWLDQGSQSPNNTHSVHLHCRTRHSKIELGMAARVEVFGAADARTIAQGFQSYPTLITHFLGQPGQTVTLDKVATVCTSRETVAPAAAAIAHLANLSGYKTLLTAHTAAWADLWQMNDVVIEGDPTAQLAVRYNLFQLLAATPQGDLGNPLPMAGTDPATHPVTSGGAPALSIPAKTLSGFAYRGHIFWDTEIFILPVLTLTQPLLARNLLNYRYQGLAGARRKAKVLGYEGAMYAWESADTGDETTPTWIPCFDGSLVRIWCGELEVHISTDVAYAMWHYWQATSDHDWMAAYGAEVILDTAVFWASRVVWNDAGDRYEIRNVIGPDEYHEKIDNNVFTNRMVQWHLKMALDLWAWLRHSYPDRATALQQQLELSPQRLQTWHRIVQKLWILQDPDTGLMEQFQGFWELTDVDLATYEPRDRSMQVILGIEGANQRQVLKQADVLMLMYLLRGALFTHPSDSYDLRTLQANWDYYEPRTDHTYGSSLGPPVHAILACDLGKPDVAYEHFMRAALVDLADVRGNAAEGIHAASTGGIWQSVILGFGGVHFTPSGPIAYPRLPQGWKRLKFQLMWQGQRYAFDLRPDACGVPLPTCTIPPIHSQPIQGVIFDLDGVLTDTSEFHCQAWQRLADEWGLTFDRQMNENLRGVSRRDSLLYMLQGKPVAEEQLQEMMHRKNAYYLDLIQTITPDDVLPGVRELLQELRAVGVKIALGSASQNAQLVIRRLGIADWMDAVADGHSVSQPKPAPDVFLYAAEHLGLKPQHCLVVEDATAGIEAALRAGMWTVGLGPQERVGAAHVVLPSLARASWTMLQERLLAKRRSPLADLSVQQLRELARV
jgi:beta-phosphoglucomutase